MKTFSRVYDTYGQARQVVADLNATGIPDSRISLVANKHVSAEYDDVDEHTAAATGLGVGAAVGGAGGMLAGLGILAIPGVGPVVAAGWLASTLLGAAAGAATARVASPFFGGSGGFSSSGSGSSLSSFRYTKPDPSRCLAGARLPFGRNVTFFFIA